MAFGPSHLQDAMFGDALSFAETVLYNKAGVATPRSVRAVVDRNAPAAVDPMTGSLSSMILLSVRNDAELGISATEIDYGRDRITMSDRTGGANASHKIVRIVSHDGGMLQLEVK